MELMELYNSIQNPIDDEDVIRKLINAYSISSQGLGGFYGKLTKTVTKQYIKGEHYSEDSNRFYAMMFNKWKNSIVAMSKEEFKRLYTNGSYDKDFIKMREYLKSVPDVSTKKEAEEVFFGNKNDQELEDALDKYRWTALGGTTGWVHVCSRYVTAKKDEYPKVEHRLYLDTEAIDTYKMITRLVEKFDEHKLPYYFKFDQYGNRDDTIVIYSSTENLAKYIEILQEIKKEDPELVSRAKNPPTLTGKIDGWIGYGSEPAKLPSGKNQSFNEVRTKVIEPAIEKVTKNWIMTHRTMNINYHNQTLNFQDYIAMKSTESFIASLEKRFKSQDDMERRKSQHNNMVFDQSVTINKLGYSLQDISTPQFKQNIYNILRRKMNEALPEICDGKYSDVKPIEINVRNGKHISFCGTDLERIIQEISLKISNNDPNFISLVQAEIRKNATQYGIDTDKFCFDIAARQKMEQADKTRKPQTESKEETNVLSANPNLNEVYKETISQIIDPDLLNKRMKLPNGVEISAKQYLEELVYPQLPSSGIVVLRDSSILPVKEFIEKCVMGECQDKYNGNFSKYIAEETKNNLGVITIESEGENHEIAPENITDFMDKSTLEQRVNLPNGVSISAKQYIEEIFAPHIPSNGRITLSNGIDISAKQYIEEVLLGEGQSKYNGDISAILSNTTRNNVDVINTNPNDVKATLRQLKKQIENFEEQRAIGKETAIEGGVKS